MKNQSHSAKATRDKFIKEKIKKLPDEPGVYFFLGQLKRSERGLRKNKILYIGKATSLRDRVKSYFSRNIADTRSPLISKMLSEFDDIEFIKTDSVLEALVLEAKLIKKYQPEANIKEKDDRSFNYVVITKEYFPRVLVARGRELGQKSHPSTPRPNVAGGQASPKERGLKKNTSDSFPPPLWGGVRGGAVLISKSFGPFPNGSQLKEAMKIVRKMFPFRDKCIPFFPSPEQGKGRAKRGVGCFNRQIGLCPGVCTGEISKKEYAETIKNIILFFESDKKKLIKSLEKQMKNFARIREFEKAGKIKKTIFTLNHIQDISLLKETAQKEISGNQSFRIESYDIAHLSGTNMVGVMTVMENGEIKKSDYRKFRIKGQTGADDTRALSEVLTRRLAHPEWLLPNLIVVDGGIAQKEAMKKVLKENKINVPVVAVVKDTRHRPKKFLGGFFVAMNKKNSNLKKEILLANSEAHRFAINFHKKLRHRIIK